MTYETSKVRKLMRWRFLMKAVGSFDQKTQAIVLSCWGAAILSLFLALYTVNAAVQAKHELATALSKEPAVPVLVSKDLVTEEISPIADQLKMLFQGLIVQPGHNGSLLVASSNGADFREWLTSLGYLEVLNSQARWRLIDFCVGASCGGSMLMKADLQAQKNSFVVTH